MSYGKENGKENGGKPYGGGQPEKILGWLKVSKSGKALLIKLMDGEWEHSVPISSLKRLLDGEIQGLPIKEFGDPNWKKGGAGQTWRRE